jgi:hypothetical protein
MKELVNPEEKKYTYWISASFSNPKIIVAEIPIKTQPAGIGVNKPIIPKINKRNQRKKRSDDGSTMILS